MQDIETGLQKMHSLNEESCVSVLGPPTQKLYLNHQVQLTWMRRDPARIGTPTAYAQHGEDAVTGEPIVIEPGEKKDHICIIKVLLDKDRVVQHAFAGDRKGCRHWANVLNAKFSTDTFSMPD